MNSQQDGRPTLSAFPVNFKDEISDFALTMPGNISWQSQTWQMCITSFLLGYDRCLVMVWRFLKNGKSKASLRAGLTVDCSWVAFKQAVVTFTMILYQVIRHTVVHQSSMSIYIENFTEIGKTFLDGLTAGTPPNSRLRDTKTRKNIKTPASKNLDIVL